MERLKTFTITGTSPAAAGKAVLGSPLAGLTRYSSMRIDALLVGATGGVLDVYLQRLIPGTTTWLDWLHYTQLAAGGAAIDYTTYASGDVPNVTISTVGQLSTDLSTGSLVLAANTFLGGHPGDQIRAVCNAGASTSAGAALTIYVTGFELYT